MYNFGKLYSIGTGNVFPIYFAVTFIGFRIRYDCFSEDKFDYKPGGKSIIFKDPERV